MNEQPNNKPWRDIATDPPKESDLDSLGLVDFWQRVPGCGGFWTGSDPKESRGAMTGSISAENIHSWRHTQAWMDAQAMSNLEEMKAKYTEQLGPSATQVGGSHYKDFQIQPAEFITKNNLGFLEGCVIKRMCRHGAKNGKEDLLKAKHEIDLMIAYHYPDKQG